MSQELPRDSFVRLFDLDAARKVPQLRAFAPAHQSKALAALKSWYSAPAAGEARGALLVLPTGGGKTFTAVRFLCEWPISDGYKVLWLAHTHHLLEQAFDTFGPIEPKGDDHVEVAAVRPPRAKLQVKVVSGMPGHAKVRTLSAKDDVVIGSLQTLAGAQRDDHESLTAFIDSAKGKLFVVFDEAHHAPAPTYARFVDALRERVNDLRVLGLTATPVYENKLRAGWLHRLFPQGIIAQTSVTQLLADGVLARPKIEQHQTHFKADFDDGAFKSWSKSYGDLPPDLIESLATNQARNDFIVKTYLDNRERYGRTLIFADRWFQCDYLRQSLRRHGVKADVVYSHVDATPGTVEARNRRDADENTEVIRAFKRGELDVLINVRMLTEGTDVPNVQTVFLTRQTTSRVLMTQMVGRALRGPAFGGTEFANVVSFLDEWRQLVQWAGFTLGEGPTDERLPETGERVPLNLISIAMVRSLAEQMYTPGRGRRARSSRRSRSGGTPWSSTRRSKAATRSSASPGWCSCTSPTAPGSKRSSRAWRRRTSTARRSPHLTSRARASERRHGQRGTSPKERTRSVATCRPTS
ncbi:MAG: DEAD/DEAH box helicase [Polyangiales bacterium]